MRGAFCVQHWFTASSSHSALRRDARIGLSATSTNIGFVCEEYSTRAATQLERSIGTSNSTSRTCPSATTFFTATGLPFTTISTGGFANHGGSFGFFDSSLVEWMGVAGMFLGGLSLAVVWSVLRGQTSRILGAREFWVYCALISGATALIAVLQRPGDGFLDTVRISAFTATSAVSSTGHWVADWSQWQPGMQMMLVVLIGWVFFRAQDLGHATLYLRRALRFDLDPLFLLKRLLTYAELSPTGLAITLTAGLALIGLDRWSARPHALAVLHTRPVLRHAGYAALVLAILFFGVFTDQRAFIYFQF